METLKLASWVDWVEPRCRRLNRLAGKELVDQFWLNGYNRVRRGNLGIRNIRRSLYKDVEGFGEIILRDLQGGTSP